MYLTFFFGWAKSCFTETPPPMLLVQRLLFLHAAGSLYRLPSPRAIPSVTTANPPSCLLLHKTKQRLLFCRKLQRVQCRGQERINPCVNHETNKGTK